MKRSLLALLAGGGFVALLVVAAPALSVRPYVPRPVDFEMAPPPGAARAARSGAVTSAPLRAPKRFNVVGLRWRGGGEARVAMRVRAGGGRWSPWRALDAEAHDGPDPRRGEPHRGGLSAPLWAGQADWVQFRSSRPLPGVRLHFVNSTGTATAAERAATAVRRVAHRGLVAVARPALAHAAGAEPAIVTRTQWGGDRHCAPRAPPAYGEVKAAFVHHTVTANDYTPAQAPSIVLGIGRYHRDANGWNDLGYHFLVDKYGKIYEGRAGGLDRAVVGAQAQGFNAQSTGVSNIGNFAAVPQTRAAVDAMARLLRWKLPVHGQPTGGSATLTSAGGATSRWPAGTEVTFQRVSGHRDGNATSCPGDALYAQIPTLRRRVAATWAPATRLRAEVAPTIVTYGRRVRMRGRLTLRRGGVVRGARVEVEQRDAAGWRPVGRARTRADGRFSALVAPPGRRLLRASFLGSRSGRPATSSAVLVRVRAALTAAAPATVAAGDAAIVSGTIGPAKPRVTIAVDREFEGRYRRLATLEARAASGRYARRYRPREPGRYRFRAIFGGDREHLAGRSPFVIVRALGAGGGAAPQG